MIHCSELLKTIFFSPSAADAKSVDEQKAIILWNKCEDTDTSPFFGNDEPEYIDIVKYLSRFMRLTEKDLSNIIDFEKVISTGIYLEEGHLNERFVKVK